MSSMMSNQCTARFESLEGRTLMAGNPLGVTQISYMGGVQLKVAGTSGNDQITVKKTANGIVLGNTGGWVSTIAGSFKSILIDGAAGNDSITVDTSVTCETVLYGGLGNDSLTGGNGHDRLYGGDGADKYTGGAGNDVLVSIGGGQLDSLTGGVGNDSFWTDSNEKITDASATENSLGAVHRVGSFMSYTIDKNGTKTTTTVSRELLGQSLLDPVVTSNSFAYKKFASNPLFSESGPSADDISQGAVGDCYFLATLSSVAKINANLIRQSIVDLGDGTYAVQFTKGSTKTFVRVDGDLATYSWGATAYADLGKSNSMWVAIMEKAFAFFRETKGTYASISAGWMSEVYSALGKSSSGIYSSAGADSLVDLMKTELKAGKSVTFAVKSSSGAPLIGGHAYSVHSITTDSAGKVTGIKLRNPWGVDGAGNDGNDDGYVVITPAQAHAAFMGMSCAAV